MNNLDFWTTIREIIAAGFMPEGLHKLNYNAKPYINGRIVYQLFSPIKQLGCTTVGAMHIVVFFLAGAETATDKDATANGNDFKREVEHGARQATCLEQWVRAVGHWTESMDEPLPIIQGKPIVKDVKAKVYDHVTILVKSNSLDYFIQPIFTLDRIHLHNYYSHEILLTMLGFGCKSDDELKKFKERVHLYDEEIADYMRKMGIVLRVPRNWTCAIPDIYLSDMYDENVLRSPPGTIYEELQHPQQSRI